MVPKSKDFTEPVFLAFIDGKVHSIKGIEELMVRYFSLSQAERREMTEKEHQTRVYNRTLWAINDLCHAQLLERFARGQYKISARGLKHHQSNLPVNYHTLIDLYPEFRDFKNGNRVYIDFDVFDDFEKKDTRSEIEKDIQNIVDNTKTPQRIILLSVVIQAVKDGYIRGNRVSYKDPYIKKEFLRLWKANKVDWDKYVCTFAPAFMILDNESFWTFGTETPYTGELISSDWYLKTYGAYAELNDEFINFCKSTWARIFAVGILFKLKRFQSYGN